MRAAASRTFWTAGSSRPMRIAMMAITTSSSISVNADRREPFGMTRPSERLGRSYENRPRLAHFVPGTGYLARHLGPDNFRSYVPSGASPDLTSMLRSVVSGWLYFSAMSDLGAGGLGLSRSTGSTATTT